MFTRIPGTHLEDSGNWYHIEIPGDIEEDSGECLRVFQGMLKKIPKFSKIFRGMLERFWEFSKRFLELIKKVSGNNQEESKESKFRFILQNLACFYQSLQLNCYEKMKKKKKNNYWEIFLREVFSTLLLITNFLSLVTYFPTFFCLLSLLFFMSGKMCNY